MIKKPSSRTYSKLTSKKVHPSKTGESGVTNHSAYGQPVEFVHTMSVQTRISTDAYQATYKGFNNNNIVVFHYFTAMDGVILPYVINNEVASSLAGLSYTGQDRKLRVFKPDLRYRLAKSLSSNNSQTLEASSHDGSFYSGTARSWYIHGAESSVSNGNKIGDCSLLKNSKISKETPLVNHYG